MTETKYTYYLEELDYDLGIAYYKERAINALLDEFEKLGIDLVFSKEYVKVILRCTSPEEVTTTLTELLEIINGPRKPLSIIGMIKARLIPKRISISS